MRTTSPRKYTLVVEEDALQHFAMVRCLEALGFPVLSAESGDQALRLVQHYKRDIGIAILGDQLSGMSGIQTARAIRVLAPKIPRVLITADRNGLLDDHDLGQVFSLLLEKPICLSALNIIVGSAHLTVEHSSCL